MEQVISSFYDTLNSDESEERPDRAEFMEELAKGTSEMASDIDHRITSKSANWRLERMPTVDRNILRMAIYEMAREETPAAVVIDEALELARQFSGEESVPFINGILDGSLSEHGAGRQLLLRSLSSAVRSRRYLRFRRVRFPGQLLALRCTFDGWPRGCTLFISNEYHSHARLASGTRAGISSRAL